MKKYIIIATLLLIGINQSVLAQTQEEIDAMLNGTTTTAEEKTEKVKKEKTKKEKKVKDASSENLETEIVNNITEDTEVEDEDPLSNSKPKKLIKIADALAEEGSGYNALEYYEAALMNTSKKKKLVYLNNQLGESNFMLKDYKLAQKYFERTVEQDTKGKYPKAIYQLANVYKHQAKYDTAKNVYRSFLSETENNSKFDFEKGRSRLEIKGCSYADTLLVDFPLFEVENAGTGINGPFSDYGPALINGTLYYSKINSQNVITLDEEERTDDEYSRIYQAHGGHSHKVAAPFNNDDYYNGNPSFTADGKTMYFTKCELTEGTKVTCAIYVSDYSNGEWQAAEKLNNVINVEGINTTQPQITTNRDGDEVLYFVADQRDRGRGGKDIWFAQKNEEGTFDNPKNLGYPLNTRYDDMSPFYHESSETFYFSSNGHTSIGGFDVFKSEKDEDGDWLEAQNMETPLNSSYDDYDFVMAANSDQGYVVSNRVGTTTLKSETCCDDIFEVTPSVIELYISGLVYEENTKRVSLLAEVSLVDMDSEEIVASMEFSGEPFLFEIEPDKNYILSAENINYDPFDVEINTDGINKSDTLYQDLILKDRKERVQFVLGTIYYEFDRSKLRSDAPDTLAKVLNYMENNPLSVVEVGAHTDAKGTDEYNEALSKKRSESGINYLIDQGISANRLEQKSYSETQPVAPNTNEDGSDNPEGRALNRRTEFKVIRLLEK